MQNSNTNTNTGECDKHKIQIQILVNMTNTKIISTKLNKNTVEGVCGETKYGLSL